MSRGAVKSAQKVAVKARPKTAVKATAKRVAAKEAARVTSRVTAKAAGPAPKKSVAQKAGARVERPTAARKEFFEAQRQRLLEERDSQLRAAEALQAQADSLALEHEPGDVQFDEEGGEGGTANVDREVDLVLSAQARATVAEIDKALEKIDAGTYGTCESCGRSIPDARLQVLPHATLCVNCKSGGLSLRH